jgi:hypothetical protein
MSGAYEYGMIHLSKGQFDKINRVVRNAYNKNLEHQYELAMEVYKKLKSPISKDLEYVINLALHGNRPKTAKELEEEFGVDPKFWDSDEATKKVSFDLDPDGLIRFELTRSKPGKLYRPRKKSFAPVSRNTLKYKITPSTSIVMSPRNKTFDLPSLSKLNDNTNLIRWTAYPTKLLTIKDLRNLPTPQALFNALGKIKRWGCSHGAINRCDGEYIAETFGKKRRQN